MTFLVVIKIMSENIEGVSLRTLRNPSTKGIVILNKKYKKI